MDSPAPRAFVIGHPIAHSRSPLLHGFWLRSLGLAGSYERVDVAPANLTGFVRSLADAGWVGGNVTIPHKTAVMALVDDLDVDAEAIGAVNTLWLEGGRLVGGNTDAIGFVANLDEEAPGWDDGAGRRAVVLGAGGAARAVLHGLRRRGFEVVVANRTEASAVALAARFRGEAVAWDRLSARLAMADVVVNTTSLGMAGQPPLRLDLSALHDQAVVCDIVYVPLETALLQSARARGLRAVGGLGMLLHQAVPGFARWFGVTPTVTPALREVLSADVRARAA